MKRVILMIALFLTVGISYSFATSTASNDDVKGEIRISFEKNFKGAQIISSEVHNQFTKLVFKMDNVIFFAFYTDNGELLAVTRNILSSQLPVNLMMHLKNDYNGYWITELFEMNGDDRSSYYVSLESADRKLTLRSIDGNSWEVYSKADKK